MDNTTDVIIVGAGPAGCAAAIQCLKAGLQCIIVDSLRENGLEPGETLHPGVESLFDQLGIITEVNKWDFIRHTGIWTNWNDKVEFTPYCNDENTIWYGYQVPRAALLLILRKRVGDLGGIFHTMHAREAIMSDNRVCGVRIDSGELYAKYVIDASGRRMWLSRTLRISVTNHSPCLIAQYGYMAGSNNSNIDLPCIQANENGWEWMAMISTDVFAWVRLYWNTRKIVRDYVPHTLSGLNQLQATRSANVTWRILNKVAGNGYFVIGEAAAILDPASSHGIIHGLMSGIMSAYLIINILRQNISEEYAEHHFSEWIRTQFTNQSSMLKDLYSNHPFRPEWTIKP